LVSGSCSVDCAGEELDPPPLVAEPEVLCVAGGAAALVFGALEALLAHAASNIAATLAMPTPATRTRDSWLIWVPFLVISRPARARWSVVARRN
jgi:hypothetical protein